MCLFIKHIRVVHCIDGATRERKICLLFKHARVDYYIDGATRDVQYVSTRT